MKTLISRLTMKRQLFCFYDNASKQMLYEYKDKYGEAWLTSFPFFPWNKRTKRI